jgi:hypothetical protein
MKTVIRIIIGVIVLGYIYWRSKPIKNSHKLPQSVELVEFNNRGNDPKFEGILKGHNFILSREKGKLGYNLFITIDTNGKDLTDLKKIIISWSEWPERIFNFYFSSTNDNVFIQGDQIRIDVGSFNNCNGSKNFLKRTAASNIMKVDLLVYVPEQGDFEYEKNYDTQSVFCPFLSKQKLHKFKKGLHFLDS